MNNTRIPGELEIDHDRGVIYFHTTELATAEKWGGVTIMRICRLPAPIPHRAFDITHLAGCDWRQYPSPELPGEWCPQTSEKSSTV